MKAVKKLEIKNKLGLHARAAAMLVQTVNRFSAEVKISKDGQVVDGRSIMGLLTLGAAKESKIQVRVLGGGADVVSVNPYIKPAKGKKEGRLWLDVVVKNTASEPKAYSIFGQARTNSGGWLGGMSEVPEKGKLVPGKEAIAKVRTSYEAAQVPKEIRVEILPAQ